MTPADPATPQADTHWDPRRYRTFGDERSRPLVDLLGRVPVEQVNDVVDLGCGPGTDTPVIRERWPGAMVHGVDSSHEMIEAARRGADPHTEYRQVDVRQWLAETQSTGLGERPQVIVSNAMFQWVDGHRELLPEIADMVAPGGAFAFQVPGNFDAPSHVLLREIASRPEYARHITEKLRDTVIGAEEYLGDLSRPGWSVDAWETTYMHVLQGENPVYEWISSTGARPVLHPLPAAEQQKFIAEYQAALREAYPVAEFGTVLPFRRIFVVATRSAGA
ncbi:methyltransferase domain-containing protein [Kocuria massiliensis]|uniref:methyltransferase domain-containing protein n=1 Tax=Kocuria massiliensis TaxID=1926282 RepID=UPI000A1CD038|nr:methyltransferase domain-containing protein [Kocuria massiliensis]